MSLTFEAEPGTARWVRVITLIVVALGLGACPSIERPAPAPQQVPGMPAGPGQGATLYSIDAQASSIRILVYKGGTLARFGHNHVMSVGGLSGRVWSHAELQASGFDLAFPVAALTVDDPDARRAAGSDFPPEIPAKDREGTRKNMLRAETLDADNYPEITLKSLEVAGTWQQPAVKTRITIRGASHDVTITPEVRIVGARLTATGEFDLLQTDFGIKPFSAALGALEVQDRLHVQFSVIAVRP